MLRNLGRSWFKFDFVFAKNSWFHRLASAKDPLSFLSITVYRAPLLVCLNRPLLFSHPINTPVHLTTQPIPVIRSLCKF